MVIKGNFKEDLKIGEQIEDGFIEKVMQRNPTATIERPAKGERKDRDVKVNIPGKPSLTFEVKYDMACDSTGNVAFEVAYKGKPSGFKASKADYFVYYVQKKFWICKTDQIQKKIYGYEQVMGGDNNNSELWLIDLREFKYIFTLYN